MRRNTDEKRAAAAEKRRALIAAEKSLDAVKRAEMLAAAGVIRTVEGAALSPKNTLLVAMQAGAAGFSASLVGGFKQWRENGRRVRKGARGLLIAFPCKGKNGDGGADNDGDQDDGGENGGGARLRFGWGYVFDVSQTVEAGAPDGVDTEAENVEAEKTDKTRAAVEARTPDVFKAAAEKSAAVEAVEVPAAVPSVEAAAGAAAGGVDFMAAALAAIA